jgi:hypothetical protein
MRNEKGQFIKGTTGNPKGRSPKQREERFYDITMSAVTYDEWKAIVMKAVDQAKRGDSTARKWLADYLIGTPIQNVKQEITDTIITIDLLDDDDD